MKLRFQVVAFVACAALSGAVPAADPDWLWAKQADVSAANATAVASAVAVDPTGNIYVAGSFAGSIKIGSATLTATVAGYRDLYVAKFDSAGNVLWALSAAGQSCSAGGIAATATRVYLTGGCMFGGNFGGHPLPANPNYRTTFFLATLDPAGSFTRMVSSGGTGLMQGNAVTVDGDGNVLVAGSFDQTVTVLGGGLSNGSFFNGDDAFVAKFNAATDQLIWAKSGGSDSKDHAYAVSTDGAGNVYVVGDILSDVGQGTATFGSTTLTVGIAMHGDPFVAKLDKNGNWMWAKSMPGRAFDEARAVVADNSGNVYVGGRFAAIGTFDSIVLRAPALNSYSAFIAKLDTNGNFLWAQQAGSADDLISVDAAANGLAINASGNPVVTGFYSGKSNFGSISLTSAYKADIFVAEMDRSSGNFLWVKSAGGSSASDFGFSLVVAPGGNLVAVGSFEDTAAFGSIALHTGRDAEFYIDTPFVAVLATGTPTSTTRADCLFNWAESSYRELFSPKAQSVALGPYYLRYYTQTSTYLAVSGGSLVYLGPLSGNQLADLGPISAWYATAGCS